MQLRRDAEWREEPSEEPSCTAGPRTIMHSALGGCCLSEKRQPSGALEPPQTPPLPIPVSVPRASHPLYENHSPGTRLLSATGLGRAHGGMASWPLAGYLGKPWLAWPCGCRWREAAGTAPPGSAAPVSRSSGCRHPTLLSPTWRQTGQR